MRYLAPLVALVLLTGCATQTMSQPPSTAPRPSSHAAAEVFGDTPDMLIWAEGDTRPTVSRLLADPKDGVWGGQDGELFHFRVRPDTTFGRVTYGRPHPAAVWVGDLVRLSEHQLAGRVITQHLVRKTPDGKVTDLAPGRSPGGAPFDLLDDRAGRLHLRDQQGNWYTLGEQGTEFTPVQEFSSGRRTGHPGLGASQQQELERETGGHVQGGIVPTANGNSYALVSRDQLFLFDAMSGTFTLLGHPGLEPVGSLNGQIVARSAGGLSLINAEGQIVREVPVDTGGQYVFQGANGWFYLLPFSAVNLVTGEERSYNIPELRGAVSWLIPFRDGRMVGATAHGGSVFLLDPETGEAEMWGRPIPELGQTTGEERAPITGIAQGSDGYLYVAIGNGASGRRESQLVRMDETGRVVARTALPEPIHGLVQGADGRIYGAGFARVVVLPPNGKVR